MLDQREQLVISRKAFVVHSGFRTFADHEPSAPVGEVRVDLCQDQISAVHHRSVRMDSLALVWRSNRQAGSVVNRWRAWRVDARASPASQRIAIFWRFSGFPCPVSIGFAPY
jgi:hypothetical protein